MASHFEKIILRGTAEERGFHYGQVAADKIKACIATYESLFKAYIHLSWDACKKKAELFLPAIKDYSPEIVEEMRGVARGAGLDFGDILAINCRSEMMFSTKSTEGCTAVGLTSEATGEAKPYLAQTWDWILPARDFSLVLEIHQEKKPTILTVVEAGMVGGKGLNSAGLGVCLNALSSGEGTLGVPLHILYRGILNAWKLPDAIQAVACHPRAGAGNFTMGADSDQALFLEYTPDMYDIIYAEDGFVAHTNHYQSPMLVAKDKMRNLCSDTFTRLGQVRKLLKKNYGHMDRHKLAEIFSDHLNYPDSLCSHPDPLDDAMMRNCTVYGMILDLKERTLWLSDGNPCETTFYPFCLMPGDF